MIKMIDRRKVFVVKGDTLWCIGKDGEEHIIVDMPRSLKAALELSLAKWWVLHVIPAKLNCGWNSCALCRFTGCHKCPLDSGTMCLHTPYTAYTDHPSKRRALAEYVYILEKARQRMPNVNWVDWRNA